MLKQALELTISKATDIWSQIVQPDLHSYFYWLLALSVAFWLFEILWPWRKKQARLRRDFYLDAAYMYFNLFIFPLLGFFALAELTEIGLLHLLGISNRAELILFDVQSWPLPAKLPGLFILRDFVQWLAHVLLHRFDFLWQFHKVHHSVREMGFAAHLRYHWFENIYYRLLEYLPLAIIGFGPVDFFAVYIISLAIGHWNHANINPPLGPLKYIFNHPQMHIWHHAWHLPDDRKYGVNFGLSLSIWDFIFGTAYMPRSGRDEELGFPELEKFPESFWGQLVWPFWKKG